MSPKFEDIIDQALIDRLTRWFGEPDAAPNPAPEPPEPPDDGDDAAKEDEALRAAVAAAIFPDLLERLEQRADIRSLLFFPSAPGLVVERDVRRSRPDANAPLRSYEPDEYRVEGLRAVMRECAPQALLRDLHRPERDVSIPVPELHEVVMQRPAGWEAAQALRRSYFVKIDEISRGWAAAQAALDELSELLAKPWEDAKPKRWGA
jgi:hypothetical protein